jgi:TetR/AcrR family transcriptional regulator, repressor for neighboring sulfatase
VTAVVGVREQQRAASEAAILDAAWSLFARSGPDGTPLREVATEAGCTHALIARYYGSKEGLVDAVGERLTTRVDTVVAEVEAASADPMLGWLRAARGHPSGVRLLVRCALGDLHPEGFPACLPTRSILAITRAGLTGTGATARRRARLCAYAASSMLLGWVTFEGFLVAAAGLGRVTGPSRDAAVAAVARRVIDVAASREPGLAARDLSGHGLEPPPTAPTTTSARAALLRSAIELFSESGPASVSVREVARHAGVNQGLIYRHFGSKQALLTEAIEAGSSGLFPAALAADGFDFDAMSHLVHHRSPAPRLIARTLVDGIEISTVRSRFPVLRSLLGGPDVVPEGPEHADHTDRRITVAASAGMALGSAIWGGHLRRMMGLADDDGIESAVADIARHLLSPAGTIGPTPKASR